MQPPDEFVSSAATRGAHACMGTLWGTVGWFFAASVQNMEGNEPKPGLGMRSLEAQTRSATTMRRACRVSPSGRDRCDCRFHQSFLRSGGLSGRPVSSFDCLIAERSGIFPGRRTRQDRVGWNISQARRVLHPHGRRRTGLCAGDFREPATGTLEQRARRSRRATGFGHRGDVDLPRHNRQRVRQR